MKTAPDEIWKEIATGRKVRVLSDQFARVVEFEYLHNRGQRGRKGRKASLFLGDFTARFKYSK